MALSRQIVQCGHAQCLFKCQRRNLKRHCANKHDGIIKLKISFPSVMQFLQSNMEKRFPEDTVQIQMNSDDMQLEESEESLNMKAISPSSVVDTLRDSLKRETTAGPSKSSNNNTNNQRFKVKHKWSIDATRCLIAVMTDHKSVISSSSGRRMGLQKATTLLKDLHACNYTVQDVKYKWGNLLTTYRRQRRERDSSLRTRIHWEFFDEIDAIYGDCIEDVPPQEAMIGSNLSFQPAISSNMDTSRGMVQLIAVPATTLSSSVSRTSSTNENPISPMPEIPSPIQFLREGSPLESPTAYSTSDDRDCVSPDIYSLPSLKKRVRGKNLQVNLLLKTLENQNKIFKEINESLKELSSTVKIINNSLKIILKK